MLVSNNNTLSKKRTIMKSIENIRCHSGYAGLGMLISTVFETSGVFAIRHERAETRDEGHIRERSPCPARLVQTRRFASRAFVKVGVLARIAYT